MKRLCCLLICLSLLLCACGSDPSAERWAAFAGELSARRDLRFTARLCAEYPDEALDYTLSYEETAEGCTLRLLEPEALRGLRVSLRPDGTRLSLDELSLDAAPLDAFGLSPASALPALTAALRGGHLESHWTEDGLTVVELTADDALSVQVWLDGDFIPQRAELRSDGRVAVRCELSDWS
ncbi:MAG: hypothetical protein K6G17_04950 [Oscillospiraceae bacterium]|nr:hypothetical protein [Oscillospiraceae bacterium]